MSPTSRLAWPPRPRWAAGCALWRPCEIARMTPNVASEAVGYSLENIPITYRRIVEEIADVTSLPRDAVEHRVWMEALQLGWNVGRDVKRFGATPHEFDSRMERSFIFETLVFWATPFRQQWIFQALDRIHHHACARGVSASEMRILLLGDGAGNDSFFFARNGFSVDYFDVPGSATYNFAVSRFRRQGFLGKEIRVLGAYEDCLSGGYDAVVSFEVLEHLPDAPAAIRDMAAALSAGGIALVTESFSYCLPSFPTHLRSNVRFAGRTPFLFLSNGLRLGWYSRAPLFRPMEFVKVDRSRLRDSFALVMDKNVFRTWRVHRLRELRRVLRSGKGGR